MFKYKNLKILLLLMLFALAVNDAWAENYSWFHFTVNVKARVKTADGIVYDEPNAGHVYAKLSSNSAEKENQDKAHTHPNSASNVQSFSLNATLHAVPNTGFKFLYWTKEDDSIINASATEQNDGKATVACNATRRCFYGEKGDSDPDHAASHNSLIEQYGTYSNIFNYYAVFEPILASIAVKSNNTNLGRAICSKYDNKKDDQVTIKAYCIDYDTKFLGWEVNGEIISRENPYTFTVTNEASDEPIIYTAVFENGYNFHRIRNYVTKNYLNAISDDGNTSTLVSGGAITSLELNTNDLNDVMYEAGSIVDIYYARIPNDTRYYYDYFVQGAKASRYYDFDPDDPTSSTGGVFLRMPFDAKTYTNTWAFATANEGGFRFTDDNGTPKITMGERPESQWYIECVDKDLNTKENYFSLDPNPDKLIEVGGKYYTTLRTSWNILFNPEQMTPYVVTEVDEENGTFEMEPITGNIIPAGTPVIIETNSNDVEENRMVPTLTNSASGAVPSGNLLQHSEKYFPNQSAPVSNCKGLYKNANGQLAFGGNALSTVNGNEAYLSVTNEVILPSKIPILSLADIERSGVIDKQYTIADRLIAVEYCQVGENDVYLWCKDQGNVSIDKSEIKEGQVDFMRQGGNNAPQKDEWDQSNWVVLKLTGPEGRNKAAEAVPTINGQKQKRFIKEKTVTEKYIDNKNFMIEVENNSFTIDEGEASYTPNVYATTNFLPENLNIWGDERDGGYTSGNPNQNYFFMNPKIQEVCTVTYAVWDGSKFVVPSSSGFTGSINVAWDYNELLGVSEALTQATENSQVEIAYEFLAVVNRTDFGYGPNFETSKSNPDNSLLVYPLNLTASESSQVPTSIKDVICENKTVSHVVYYNLMGIESAVPHPGINIVVTEYSDGTRSAVKMIR